MKMTLGAFIAQLRKDKNLTQKQLSEILGVSDKTVSHWEREESAPDISVLPLLADTLGVTVDELLAGEKKAIEKIEVTVAPAPKENAEKEFYKFKQKSSAISMLSFVVGLSGTIVISMINNTWYFSGESVYTARIVTGILLTFIMIALGALTIYARIIYSAYVNKHSNKSDRMTALRFATFTYYPTFFFIPALIGACDPISSMSPYSAMILFSVIAAVVLFLAEIILIKKGLIPKWKKETVNKLVPSLISIVLATVLLTGAFAVNLGYNYNDVIYDMAEYAEFQTTQEFMEYIEKNVPVPDEKSSIQDQYTAYSGVGEVHSLPLWGVSQEHLFFEWNNGEVCSIKATKEDIVPIKCYTHKALLKAEDKAATKVFITRTGLFLLYPLSIAISISVYLAIKKKMQLR